MSISTSAVEGSCSCERIVVRTTDRTNETRVIAEHRPAGISIELREPGMSTFSVMEQGEAVTELKSLILGVFMKGRAVDWIESDCDDCDCLVLNGWSKAWEDAYGRGAFDEGKTHKFYPSPANGHVCAQCDLPGSIHP